MSAKTQAMQKQLTIVLIVQVRAIKSTFGHKRFYSADGSKFKLTKFGG